MLIKELGCGGKVDRYDRSIVARFRRPVCVISTSRLNGGYRENIEAVFNHQVCEADLEEGRLKGGSVEAYMEMLASQLALPYTRTAGLLTSAGMENAAVSVKSYRDAEVTALITAGVDVNGGRAGDPASYYERDGNWTLVAGTVNIILIINADLPPYAVAQSLITATEAKAAALQELMAPSRYSRGIATGSGTDGIIVAANPNSEKKFTDTGKHSKLGELIGLSVKEAVKEALAKETGLNPGRQGNFLSRLARYGAAGEDFWQDALKAGYRGSREQYTGLLDSYAARQELVAAASALLHLLDEVEWGLLEGPAVIETGCGILEGLGRRFGNWESENVACRDPAGQLIHLFIKIINRMILTGGPDLQKGRG
jgi:adenosylcobinamide amidohydrolase